MKRKTNKGTRGQPEQSRKAILDAASLEFATEGIAGARIDAIAKAAGVNKALLYYYFHDKESLYVEVLAHNFGGLLERLVRILEADRDAGFKILAYARTHFDYVSAHPHYRRLVQHEMMRAGAGKSRNYPRLVETFFRPLMRGLLAVMDEGTNSGEFRRVDPMHFIQSMIGVVVFYFTAQTVMRAVVTFDPLSPKALVVRREAMLDFIAGTLFADRKHGAKVMAEVLAADLEAIPAMTAQKQAHKGKK